MTAARIPESHPPTPWGRLPAEARRLLLHGSVGGEHLRDVAGRVLAGAAGPGGEPGARRELLALAQDVLLSAWADSPLDGGLAALVLEPPLPPALAAIWPTLPAPVSNLMQAQRNFWCPPPQEHPWRSASADRLGEMTLAGMKDQPHNLFWKLAAWEAAWPAADWPLVEAVLDEGAWPRTLSPLRHRFAALAHLAMGDPHRALASLNAAPLLAQHVGDAGLRSECLARAGQASGGDEAAQVLGRSLARSPWRTSQWLRLADLTSGAARAGGPLPGRVAVLLYTFNKARELCETLESLAASDAGQAPVFALDNGSTDDTAGVLRVWQERLGDRLRVVALPVNVGAPAARNWLLSLPEVREHEFVAFLDDDVVLPADWLWRFGGAVAAFPEASVWGCRVVDDANPLVVQNVDITPMPPGAGDLPLVLPRLHANQPDLGQFSYLRPCASVTGCCHLLRTADIDRTGGFDIRFSPTQLDDLERDLRLGMGGGFAAYQGHLRVRHKRRSGAAAQRSPAEIGNATANTHKLVTKHGTEDFEALRARGEARLEADLLRRMAQLEAERF
jgi:GT2 family glycosyltransferase